MKAWNEQRTDYVLYALGTRDKGMAEHMRALFLAGKKKEFEKLCMWGFEEVQKAAREWRAAAAAAARRRLRPAAAE